MAHLEDLLVEWYSWRGYIVRRNILVGRRTKGGWAGELDVVAFRPADKHLVHVEASLDANTWKVREQRFEKKFAAGRAYIHKDVFPWLDQDAPLEQIAVLVTRRAATLGGGKVVSVDDLLKEILQNVSAEGPAARKAIPQQFPLLRVIQLATNGYYRRA
jgi:hypothetical protein